MESNREIWFGKRGKSVPARKTFLSEVPVGVVPKSLWLCEEVGHNHEAKTEVRAFNASDPFATPKPERLIERVLQLATDPGDWVLDSFAGSGTTGAVAHKMGRQWIMVELGDHCHTPILPRLRAVIDGQDRGGITEATAWQGGGGFRYFSFTPSF
ncbi:MAG: methylase [Chthonomonadales bacterium]|nr:methylase [Chthonomonadales bacterium]